jgi:hypothetical protein
MRSPTSFSEKRTCNAKKLHRPAISDFFNKLGHKLAHPWPTGADDSTIQRAHHYRPLPAAVND